MTDHQYHLVMLTGPTPGSSYALTDNEISLGREISNTIAIKDAEVSRRHLLLTRVETGYMLKDLDSTNGTFVNNQRVGDPVLLSAGDTVRIGQSISLTYDTQLMEDAVESILFSDISGVEESPSISPNPTRQDPVDQLLRQDLVKSQKKKKKKGSENKRLWLWASIGCLFIMLCILILGAMIFDSLNLYCTIPFRDITLTVGYYCP